MGATSFVNVTAVAVYAANPSAGPRATVRTASDKVRRKSTGILLVNLYSTSAGPKELGSGVIFRSAVIAHVDSRPLSALGRPERKMTPDPSYRTVGYLMPNCSR